MLSKLERPLSIPAALLDLHLLVSLLVRNTHVLSVDDIHIDLALLDTLDLDFIVLVLAHIRDRKTHPPILRLRRRNIQERRLDRGTNPLRLRSALVLRATHINRDAVAAHVLAEEQERPPDSLLQDAILGRHQRTNDIDALSDIRHAQVLSLADEAVQEHGDGQRIRQRVLLLGALLAGRAHGIPHVPLVEADGLLGHGLGDLVLDAREVDEGAGHLDGALGGARRRRVGQVLVVRRVDVDAVHVDEALGRVAGQPMHVPFHALFQHVVVPGRVARLAAEDEGDAGVEELERFGPLVGFLCVVFFGELGYLPWSPAFVA